MPTKRILSFKYALEGVACAFKEEPNLKIHFLIAAVVVTLGIIFHLSTLDWLILIITIGVVISVELTNTAIESVVDSFTAEAHPGAKKAKDISAGAVLVVSIMALVIGILIFLPYLKFY
ncbi:diacylglycerol kinase family protein [Candidatus Daviesbacteria bacterium]|nr:diacylglycerol kinase family protein [Candidatus Daviesbacteria bacterium]